MFKDFKRKQASKKIQKYNDINEEILKKIENGKFDVAGWLYGYSETYKIIAELNGADKEELERHQEFGFYVCYRVESFVKEALKKIEKPTQEDRIKTLEKEIENLKKQLTEK